MIVVGPASGAVARGGSSLDAAGLLAEVTTSAVTFDADDLRAEGIADLLNFTPNLEIKTAFAASNATLFIRGAGLDDCNANSSSAVSATRRF